ncbi:MAG: hypothetical protein WCV55_01150 [Candidatus Paceibacterota bacterium]
MEDNGQINKTEELSLKDIFSNSPLNLYIFKKTNKLSIASYLLTEHIKDIEPLKWSIRKTAVQMVEGVMSFKGLNKTEVSSLLLSLRSYFETAVSVKLISKNNSEILISEIDKLAQEIGSFNPSKGAEKELGQNFFSVERPVLIPAQDLLENLKKEIAVSNKNSESVDKGHQTFKGQTQAVKSKPFRNEEEDKRQRRHKILSIIKHKKEVTIKDISSSIKECSEKTIQRELNSLLFEKVIKKVGERRWSKYLLS